MNARKKSKFKGPDAHQLAVAVKRPLEPLDNNHDLFPYLIKGGKPRNNWK